MVYFRCGRAGRLDGLIDPLFSASFPTHAAGDLLAEGILAGGTGDERFPPAAAVAPFTGIDALFPFIQHPTPLQQAVLELDISQPGPQLFILEDVTGAGKRRRR